MGTLCYGDIRCSENKIATHINLNPAMGTAKHAEYAKGKYLGRFRDLTGGSITLKTLLIRLPDTKRRTDSWEGRKKARKLSFLAFLPS
jgi:hypothetical protein